MNGTCKFILASFLTVLLGIAGCGGGSSSQSAGIGGTGKTSSGTITGFGSIFVNGVEHDTTASTISVDDSSGSESDLRIGMVVTVEGTVDGATGTASSVIYDDVLEGPIEDTPDNTDNISKRFTVLGITVVVDSSGTVFDNSSPGFGFDSIDTDDIVEISGYFDADGVLRATYIDKEDVFSGTSEVEIKGTATDADAGATLGDNFTINGIDVNIAPGADLSEVPGMLVTNGMYIEVKGDWDGTRITATRIEQEETSIGDEGDSVSLEGLVSGFTGNLASFLVAGQPVDASSAEFDPPGLQLADGVKVEAEGTIIAGVLVASEIESRGGDSKVHATVTNVSVSNAVTNEGSISLSAGDGIIQVTTDSQTAFEDETGADTSPPLKLNEINTGDFLEISAYADAGGVVATEIHRRSADDVIVQGPVDQMVDPTITVLGVTFSTFAGTSYEDENENPLSGGASQIFGTDRSGDIVKIKDDEPGDEFADEVDLED